MKNLFISFVFMVAAATAHAEYVQLGNLPLSSAATSGGFDSFPFVNATLNQTQRLYLSDLANLPALVNTFASKNDPVFSGNVTFNGTLSVLPTVASSSSTLFSTNSEPTINGNTAQTANVAGFRSSINRTITSSTTDTAQVFGYNVVAPTFSVSSGQTLTNSNSTGYSGINVGAPTAPTGGGSVTFTNWKGVNIPASTLNTGTRKTGVLIGTQTGATNNAALTDNSTYTGNWFINQTGTAASSFGGAITASNLSGTNTGNQTAANVPNDFTTVYTKGNIGFDHRYAVNIASFAGVDPTGMSDSSAGVAAAFAAAEASGNTRMYLPAGIYKMNVTFDSKFILEGDGSTATKIYPFDTAIAAITYASAAPFWTYHSEVRNVGFYSTGHTGVGFTFAKTNQANYAAGDEYDNNVKFYGVYFTGLLKGVQFPFGNIGSEFYSCGFSDNKYGVYSLDSKNVSSDIMPGGNKYFYAGQFDTNDCAVYVNNQSSGFGGFEFDGTIFEQNGIAAYFFNTSTFVAPAFNNTWIEANGAIANTPYTTVTIDQYTGSTRSDLVLNAHAFVFDGTQGVYNLNGGFVTDIWAKGTNQRIMSNQSRIEVVSSNSGQPLIVDSPTTSSIILTSPNSQGGLGNTQGVLVLGTVRPTNQTIGSNATDALSRAMILPQQTSARPVGSITGVSITGTSAQPYTGSFSGSGTVVSDGSLYTSANEFSIAFSSSAQFTKLTNTDIASTTAGWYVTTAAVKVVSGAPQFYVWNRSTAQLYQGITVPTTGAWYNIGAIGYSPGSQNLFFDVGGTSSAAVFRIGEVQIRQFATLADAQAFLASLSFTDPTISTTDVTLGTANGLSLSGQVLSLGLSSTSTTGALSSTDWNTFNGKQASGNYITALTGDVTAAGPGSSAATVARVQGTTVSGTTGTTNVVFSNSPTLVTPALGTPTALVGTNITGTASGLTAGSVTTNANLTGPITSSGNATSVASQTGTGSTFVMNTSPTLVTPALGTPTALVGTNITGTASGLTAGNVTTNANLTGPITSTGNATAIASQTGTGNTFVMNTSPTLITPALGTPTALVGTNITGTASGLTAGSVTTNANLTGPITSVGNATSVAAQTGTGSTFVMNTSPTLVTPVIGAATGTSLVLSGNVTGGLVPLSFTSGSIPYYDGTLLNQDNANFFYDASNIGLRIGTNTAINTGDLISALKTVTAGGTSGASMSINNLVTGNTPHTGLPRAIRAKYNRTITLNTTDTGEARGINTESNFDVPAGQTLTNTNANGISGITVSPPTITGGGALAATQFSGIRIPANNIATGTRKAGILLQAQTGATNNAAIADGVAFTGDYFINESASTANVLNGALTVNAQLIGMGTATNNSAATGYIGEYVESLISTPTSVPAATTQWGDATSISLTAGDWDVTALVSYILNGATITVSSQLGISTTSGNSATGLVEGVNWIPAVIPTASNNRGAAIPSYRMSLSGTTTVYLKSMSTYSAGTPQFQGRLSARRVR